MTILQVVPAGLVRDLPFRNIPTQVRGVGSEV